VSAAATLISIYLAVTWRIAHKRNSSTPAAAAAAAAAIQQQQDEDGSVSEQQQQKQDGLIWVLVACLLLLTWTAASRLAQYDHPDVASLRNLYYPVSVLPELIVAYVLAVPTLAARVALGRGYQSWLKLRQQQSAGNSSSGGVSDAQVVGIDNGNVQMSKV
jgi:hypothetical protein